MRSGRTCSRLMAFGLVVVCGCGARTGLLVDEDEAGGDDADSGCPWEAGELDVRVPSKLLQVGYETVVAIEAEVVAPAGCPVTYEWRQISGPDVTETFEGQGTSRLVFTTRPLDDLVTRPGRFTPIAIPPPGQGEYVLELAVSAGLRSATGRTYVRSASVSGGWPRLPLEIDGYFDCGGLPDPSFAIEQVSPCPPESPSCDPPELGGGDTCTPRLRAYYSGFFDLVEQVTGRRVTYFAGNWFDVDHEVSGCRRPDCHPGESERWDRTRHATVLARGIDGALGPEYDPSCLPCHSLGFDEAGVNAGFDDRMAASGWQWSPDLRPGNHASMPAELRAASGVQCSACHAPAFAWKGYGAGVCAQCHDAPPRYSSVAEWRVSSMSRFVRELAGDDPALLDRCTRCHSAQGFVAEANGRKPEAPSASDAEPVTCTVCHDPKSETPAMLRVTGVEPIPSLPDPVDAGRSAVCLRCHNGQVDPHDPQTVADRLAPMHGSQADLFYGSGAMSTRPGELPRHAAVAGCIDCHMEAPSDSALAGAVGGHTFRLRTPDGRSDPSACQPCHEGSRGLDVPISRPLRFEVRAEVYAAWREVVRLERRDVDRDLPEEEILMNLFQGRLRGPSDDPGKSPMGDEGRSNYQVALVQCEDCRRVFQDARGERVELPAEVLERVSCDAQYIGRVDQPAESHAGRGEERDAGPSRAGRGEGSAPGPSRAGRGEEGDAGSSHAGRGEEGEAGPSHAGAGGELRGGAERPGQHGVPQLRGEERPRRGAFPVRIGEGVDDRRPASRGAPGGNGAEPCGKERDELNPSSASCGAVRSEPPEEARCGSLSRRRTRRRWPVRSRRPRAIAPAGPDRSRARFARGAPEGA